MENRDSLTWNRRELLKLGIMSGGAVLIGSTVGSTEAFAQAIPPPPAPPALPLFPTSPLILAPFTDALPVLTPLQPAAPSTWPTVHGLATPFNGWQLGDLDQGWQNPWGWKTYTPGVTPPVSLTNPALNIGGGLLPNPIYYRIPIVRAGGGLLPPDATHPDGVPQPHAFTTSLVQPIDATGAPVLDALGAAVPPRPLPPAFMSCFNGTFPGPLIVATYGQPCVVHFENLLQGWDPLLARWFDPDGGEGADYGVPSTLTHLHNAHTSPESDGNPFQCPGGYDSVYATNSLQVGGTHWYYDNVYLNYPPDGDDREKQSFFWFHDHRMDNTSANVYSGLVGLYLVYDAKDSGDETKGYHLPGVPTYTATGAVDYTKPIQYDIPLALYDCCFDDGVILHTGGPSQSFPGPMETPPQDGIAHPGRWGKPFFDHQPNRGFVGDVFTVNGVAYPVMHVSPRRYRLRFLDCSISRWYELQIMKSAAGPVPAAGWQGQYQLPDGQQCIDFYQVASEGGLLPSSIRRTSFQIAPAKRREFVVDFSKDKLGNPIAAGSVFYLVDSLQMDTGRMPTTPLANPVDALGNVILDANGCPLPPVANPGFFPGYKVPMVKIVVDGPVVPDRSLDPAVAPLPLRALPPFPKGINQLGLFCISLERNGGFVGGGLAGWAIFQFDPGTNLKSPNVAGPITVGNFFDPLVPFARFPRGSVWRWIVRNGGGGWVHPLHLHYEEHRVLSRAQINGEPSAFPGFPACVPVSVTPLPLEPDDLSKEDVVALHPGEAVTIIRRFRSFTGKYVSHCHNLAHEDHAMMFGFIIDP